MAVAPTILRFTYLVNAVYTESAREYGLTSQQGQLLCVLMARPYGMGELGAMLRLAKSSLSGLVERTERNGFVMRESDPQDGRGVRVSLTARGARLAESFYAETCRRIGDLPAGFSTPERTTLVESLNRIALNNHVPEVFGELDGGDHADGN